MRLAVLASHPVQYQAPFYRALARRFDAHVFFAHRASPAEQANAGFATPFEWDVDLTDGYAHSFLRNVARLPDASRFAGCDTPEIGARLRAGGFDALLLMGWHLKSYMQGLIAARRLGVATLVRGDSHLWTPRARAKALAKRALYPPFLRLFDAALHVGQRSRDYYLHYGYPADRLFHAPHAVDAAWFAARATQEARERLRAECAVAPQARVVLFAGKVVAAKRPLDLVAAVARARAQGLDVQIMIAGDGAQLSETVAAAAAVGAPLHALGFRNQTQMPQVYAASDALVLPSAHETWGMVVNEALACGRPVVVSDTCGCAPDVSDGVAGRAFRMGDAARLAQALEATMAAPPSADAIARLGAKFSLETAVDGVAAAAGRACARSGAAMAALRP